MEGIKRSMIFFAVVAILAFIITSTILSLSLIIIENKHNCIVERYGKFDRVLEPGVHFIIPLIERTKYVTWIIEEEGLRPRKIYNQFIPINDQVYDPPEFKCVSKDNIMVTINIVSYYKISNVKKAVYETDDLMRGIRLILQSTLSDIIKTKDSLHIETSSIEGLVLTQTNLELVKWGVEFTSIKIQKYTIPDSILAKYESINILKRDAEKHELEIENKKRCEKARHEFEMLEQKNIIAKNIDMINHELDSQKFKDDYRLKTLQTELELYTKYKDVAIVKIQSDSFKHIANDKNSKTIILPYDGLSYLGSCHKGKVFGIDQ